MWPLNNLSNWSLDKRVLNKLKGTGFDTLSGFDKHLRLDLPLIHVLISRYDAETRSFKLGSAENPFNIAFGLEDVLYLTGLPIDGKPVTGVDPKDKESTCLRYLGKHERSGTGSRSNISLTWLREKFMILDEDDENLTEEVLAYYVRAYVLYVIGCIFAPSTQLMVSPVFLPLLENVDDIGSYAWGAALLANMHDSMENPTKSTVGLYFPLMIFAYIRFPGLSSVLKVDPAAINEFPLMVSWSHKLGLAMTQPFKKQNEKYLQTFFDSLKEGGTGEEEVKWQPYRELSSNFLPKHLREQVVLSKSRTILICFEKAVYHRPDKCQRQLGLAGHILKRKLIKIKTLHHKGYKGWNCTNWSKEGKYVEYISEWERRFDLLIDCDDLMETDALNSRVDNVDVDHQSPVDTASSRVRNSKYIRSCHPQTEASFLAGLRKAAENTSVGVTANESSSLNIEREKSENPVSNAATLPPHSLEGEVRELPIIEEDVGTAALPDNGNDDVVNLMLTSNIPVPGCIELENEDTEAGLSTRKKSKKRKKTSCGGSDSPSSLEDLSCEELAGKFSSVGKVVWKKLKQVDSTNKELQRQMITLQSDNQALQAEKQKLEASHSQKDHALTQLQKNHLALNDEASTLKVQLKQKDERVEEMVASLDQERAAAILKYKASPRFAEEFQIVMAPLLLHGYKLGVDEAKAPDLDIGSLANCDLYQHGQGDETDKLFKELADGRDILAMYKSRPPAQELANAARDQTNVDNVYVDHQSRTGDTASSRVRNPTEIRSCHPQKEGGGVVHRAEPLLIIDVKSESESDSDVSITDSLLDSIVG